MKPELINNIQEVKKDLKNEEFIILGVFESYARNEETPNSVLIFYMN